MDKARELGHIGLQVNTSEASSSGTLGSGRLFTFQTLLIEEAIGSLPPNASDQQCVNAILADERCQEQFIPLIYSEQQLSGKVKTIRQEAAREAKQFR